MSVGGIFVNAKMNQTSTTTSKPAIVISSSDLDRIERFLDREPSSAVTEALTEELSRASVLDSEDMPANVVTMNSHVRCIDELTGQIFETTLVYPGSSDPKHTKAVSVLAPFGSAILGLSVGQSISWKVPGGRELRLRVLEVRPVSD